MKKILISKKMYFQKYYLSIYFNDFLIDHLINIFEILNTEVNNIKVSRFLNLKFLRIGTSMYKNTVF